jgi:hypothetical protein
MTRLMLGGTGGLPKVANFNKFGNGKDDRCVKGLLNGISELAPDTHS